MGPEITNTLPDDGRTEEVPAVVPYMASAEWYAGYLRCRLNGMSESEARDAAMMPHSLSSQELSRSLISTPSVWLKIPLEGGSSARHMAAASLRISGHGHWRHTHKGALDAHFRRTPFYSHIMPYLEDIFSKYGDSGMHLATLNSRLHRFIIRFLRIDENLEALHGVTEEQAALLRRIGEERHAHISFDESIIAPLMRFGPEAIFPLLTSFYS